MNSPAHECTEHLRNLARFLGKLGTFGTALIDPDDALDDVWRGLLVWDIAKGARTGLVVRCEQSAPFQPWHFSRADTGERLGGVHERLRVSQQLGGMVFDSATQPSDSPLARRR